MYVVVLTGLSDMGDPPIVFNSAFTTLGAASDAVNISADRVKERGDGKDPRELDWTEDGMTAWLEYSDEFGEEVTWTIAEVTEMDGKPLIS